MPFILAIESDKRQASRIAAIARSLNGTELVLAESVVQALGTLASRVPDLILTPLLLSPKDSAALDDRLRELDAAGKQVQTLMTPMLASASRKPSPKTGLLMRLRKVRRASAPDGCEPDVFAAQITEYLDRAREQQPFEGEQQSSDDGMSDAPSGEAAQTLAAFTADVAAHASETEAMPQPVNESDAVAWANPLTVVDIEPPVALASSDEAPEPEPELPPQSVDPAAIFAERLAELSQPPERQQDFVSTGVEEEVDAPTVTTWTAVPWPDAPVPIPTDDPALAAEVAAILSTPSPSMTAGEEWVDVDMDLLAAHPTLAPTESIVDAAPIAAAMETDAAPVDTAPAPAADDFDVSEFVRALEASLAADVPKKKRRKRAVIARKPAPEPEVQGDEPEPSFDDYDPDADLWMPLPAVARAIWPQLDSALSVVRPTAAMPEPAISIGGEATRKKRPVSVTKVEPDEWGLFDPEQCGFAALLDRLDEINDGPSE